MKCALPAPVLVIYLVMQAEGRHVCEGGSCQSGMVARHGRMVCGKPPVAAACNSLALAIVHNVSSAYAVKKATQIEL